MINLLTWWNGFLSKKTAIKTNQLQSLIWREGIEEEGWDNKFERINFKFDLERRNVTFSNSFKISSIKDHTVSYTSDR